MHDPTRDPPDLQYCFNGTAPSVNSGTIELMLPRVLVAGLLGMCALSGQVRAWEDSLQLPTYAEGEPDPAPQFPAITALKDGPANYPYPFRSHISTAARERSVVTWRTLNLENQYLSCRILPDLGGHVYNCLDKLSNREVFHAPDVIKKAMIGLRGAWISAGIEPNFPAAHSRVSASPVNFALVNDSNGSASVVVSDTDHVTGMQWRVEYRLRSGVAALEEIVTFYNPTPERKPYLWWDNAAIEWDDPEIRYTFPTHLVVGHNSAALETWPVNSAGVDISQVANARSEAAWFAYRSREPFMGIYKPKFRTGLAHYADPTIVTGKKLWIMGQDSVDLYRKELTDGGNVYVEMQAGLSTDQETYQFLGPEQSLNFTEYWIPFRNLSGLTRATPELLLYAQRAGSGLDVELSSTHAIDSAKIRILSRGKIVSEVTADLDPRTVWKGTVPADSAEPFTIQVMDGRGRVLMEHREGVYDADGPAGFKAGPLAQTGWNGPETDSLLLKRGEYNETLGQTPFAQSDYNIGLKRFPRDLAFDKAQGRLALSLGEFKAAEEDLNRALSAPGADSETFYYAAIAEKMSGHQDAAARLLARVSPASEFGAAAVLEQAILAARSGNDARALQLLAPIPPDPGRGARMAGIRAALLRRTGDRESARSQVKTGLALAPEDPLVRFEATLAGAGDPALWSYLAGDAERVLDVADEYMGLGFWEDALAVLTHDYTKTDPKFVEPGAVSPASSALTAYYTAFCQQQLRRDPSAELARAASLGTRYQFPFRASSYAVLEAALEKNPSDATAHALLGNLEMYSLQAEDAETEYRKALALNPKLEVERKTMAAAADYAASVKRSSQTTAKAAVPPAAPVVSRLAAPATPSAPPKVSPEAAISLAAEALMKSAAAPEAALAVFHSPAFQAEKQPAPVRQDYIEVQLQILLVRSASGKCDTMRDQLDGLGLEDTSIPFTLYGFGQFMRTAHFQYYLGLVEANCKNTKGAEKYWAKVAKLKESPATLDFVYPLLAANRLKLPGETAGRAEAHQALQAEGSEDSRALGEALLLRLEGQEAAAETALAKTVRESKDVIARYLATVELGQPVPK